MHTSTHCDMHPTHALPPAAPGTTRCATQRALPTGPASPRRRQRADTHRRRRVQLYKLLEGAVERGCKRVRVHGLTDGRDTQDGSSVKFFGELRDFLAKLSSDKSVDARVASGGGRMNVTMDRYEVRAAVHRPRACP